MSTDIAVSLLRQRQGAAGPVTVHKTWGASLVVEADGLLLKANGDRSTVAEALIARRVRDAGVPSPVIIGEGEDPLLPGGQWLIMRRMPGISFHASAASEQQIDRVISDLARYLAILRTTTQPGWGWVGADGRGTSASWADWLGAQVRASAATLGDQLPAGFVTAALETIDAVVPELTEGSILNGDLGLSHVLVVPSTGEVTGILDWAAAIIGDPLYDIATFSMGGPAGDPIQAVLQPRLLEACKITGAEPRIHLYRMINHLFNACWSVDNDVPSWTADLCQAADDLLTAARRASEVPARH